jgi:arylsulfatase A-like enzyme
VPVPNRSGLAPDNVTLADALKAAGYATGIFGKWHLDGPDGAAPAEQGFDVVFDSRRKNPNAGQGMNEDPKGMFSITRAACEFIEENKERPFFAYVAHHAIHSGLEARPATLERFKAKARGDKHKDALYAACTHDLDTVTGQLLDKLDELGLRDNTLVVFTSDNGATKESPQEPLRGNKGCYYEGGIREPFIIRWPGVTRPGSSSSVPVIHVDLYPTFLAAAGAAAPKQLDGEDLAPLLRGDGALKRGAVFWHFPGYLDRAVIRGRDPVFRTRPVSVIRKGDWKLHLYHEEWLLDGGREKLPGNKAVELYQMRDDIGERHDLSAENPEKRDELLGDLLAWMESVDAPLPERPQGGGPTDGKAKRDRKGGKP